jgi:hypothetical protein
MNKQEAINELMSKSREIIFGDDENVYLSRKRTIELISQIHEPQKAGCACGGGVMVKTLEQTLKDESKRCKVPTNIRPYSTGYRVVSKNGNILALKDGASVFSLPSEAKKAIQKEFGKDDPNFDIERRKIEEVAIVNFEKLKKFLEEVE